MEKSNGKWKYYLAGGVVAALVPGGIPVALLIIALGIVRKRKKLEGNDDEREDGHHGN